MNIKILFLLAPVLLVLYFFLRPKLANRLKEAVPLPDSYKSMLEASISYYRKLDEDSKNRFCNMVEAFLQKIRIEGVGTEITDHDRVLIASSAVIPIFGFPEWEYQNLTNVILYPDTFNPEFQFEGGDRNILGMVGSGYMNGQMLLSRTALEKGFSSGAGRENTAIHEFVHLLDKSDGETDGVPSNFLSPDFALPWLQMIHAEIRRIEAGKSDINPYAVTNEAEFLAVAAEYFFEKPQQLKHKHPELYTDLCRIFSQDPAAGTNHGPAAGTNHGPAAGTNHDPAAGTNHDPAAGND